jgi:threonine synthase
MTPLVRAPRFGRRAGAADLRVKDEGVNPTGSFKARGMSAAVSMAVELGIRAIAIPSAGNAACALAAYAAAAGIEAHIFMPRDVPRSNFVACQACGAHVTLVEGSFSDCAARVAAGVEAHGWFDMSGLKEPYRLEGKKTMGYELAEQFAWQLPDAILYPTGGGVGVIAMWKAFAEMETLGWIGSRRPKMIAVQAAGCQPLVRAWEQGARQSEPWENAYTVAAGLRIPKPRGDVLLLAAVRESGGACIAVADQELLAAGLQLASDDGIFVAPEAATCAAALPKLFDTGFLKREERIVLFNTGSGLKYPEVYGTRFPIASAGEQDKLGGLITPR